MDPVVVFLNRLWRKQQLGRTLLITFQENLKVLINATSQGNCNNRETETGRNAAV